MPFTSADIRSYATSGNRVSFLDYQEGSNLPVTIFEKNGAIYWHSGMSIDCDGQPGSACNKTTDPYFQPNTAWNQSNGQPLKAETLPYVVLPLPSEIWNYSDSGIKGGTLAVMCYKDKYVFGVVGDLGPSKRIGEGSYAAAQALGINPDPMRGGVGSGVTYVVFPGVQVKPIENNSEAVRLGNVKVAEWLNATTEEPPVEEPGTPVPVPTTQHVVTERDTLSSVAAAYQMTVDELAALNHLVFVGQVLAVNKLDPYKTGLPVANSESPSAIPLQKELKRTGYMPTNVKEHPNYGPLTQEAVAQFHNANPQFKDGNSSRDVTINRAGWNHLTSMVSPAAINLAKAEELPQKVDTPVPGYDVTYAFGAVDTKYSIGYHTGDDYTAPKGRPVVAVLDGEIVWANDQGGAYGRWLGLRANGRDYVYCHLDAIHIGASKGATVKAGQIIGFVGVTGNAQVPHLHFEDRPEGGGYGSGRKPSW